MISLYEDHVKKLERKRTMLSEQAKHMLNIDTSFEDSVGTIFDFISNPYSLWANGDFENKRLVLKLAFAQQVTFDRETGFGTAQYSLPFKVMKDLSNGNSAMVEPSGVEPLTS